MLSAVAEAPAAATRRSSGPVVTVAASHDEAARSRAANECRARARASSGRAIPQRADAGRGPTARRLGLAQRPCVTRTAGGQAAWGGRGGPGYGRTHSKHGLYDLVNVKFADRDSGRVGVPWWFPYDDADRSARSAAARRDLRDGPRSVSRSAWRDRAALRARSEVPAMSELSHVDESGRGADGRRRRQAAQRRRAVARAVVRMAPETARACATLPKGDALDDRAAGGDHGREEDGRPDPALPSAAALARRGRRSSSARAGSRSPRPPRRPRRPASRWRR